VIDCVQRLTYVDFNVKRKSVSDRILLFCRHGRVRREFTMPQCRSR